MEAHIVYPHWWVSTEIDGAEYVFLEGKDESTGGEGTGKKEIAVASVP